MRASRKAATTPPATVGAAPAPVDGARLAAAARIAAVLDDVGRLMRQSAWAEARRLPVPLTPPQLLALTTLVCHVREAGGPSLTLSELSKRMGLAHSTVSGIVDRLERQGLVVRRARPEDRRYVDITLAAQVRDWLEHELPVRCHEPLVRMLEKATDEEWKAVLNGFLVLERLAAAHASGGAPDETGSFGTFEAANIPCP